MKQLILVRHAKARASDGELDHARPLDDRGLADAAWAGEVIRMAEWRPVIALVSDARRTQQTFALAAPFLEPSPELRLDETLYEATADTILARVATMPATASTLLVVAHNPGIGHLARRLCGAGQADALARLREGFPTAALAFIRFDVATWAEVGIARGRLAALQLPDAAPRLH